MASGLRHLLPRLDRFKSFHRKALKITAIYFLFAILWILLSDYVAQQYVGMDDWTLPVPVQTFKGLLFVVVTSALLFWGLQRAFKALQITHEQMTERERQYRHLLDHLSGFAYRCYYDAKWTMVIVNEASYELTGYYPEDLIHNQTVAFADIIDPRDQKRVEKEVKQAIDNNRRFSISYRIHTKEGKIRWVWEQGSLAFEEDGDRFLEGYISDVTQLYFLKEELGVKDLYYKMLLENANDAIFVVNFDKQNCTLTQFREVNSLACERLNFSREELLQMRPMDLEIFRNSVNLQEGLQELLETKNITFETTYLGPDNQKRYSEVNAHLFEIDYDPVIMAISRDVTDRVTARTMLEQKNQELKTLLYKSSHDLRSPTTNILGLVSIAKEDLPDQSSQHYLQLIQQSAEQMLYVLESLNNASLTKKEQLQVEQIDFQALCNKVLDKNVQLPGYQEVKISKVINDGKGFKSDSVLIECILNNLLHNAIEYRRTSRSQVTIQIDSGDQGIQLKVADNGQGISEDVQARIFEMFYRGHEYSRGSGLGLYIVKNAVEKLGGTIDFHSKPGKGTTFDIFMPSLSQCSES